MVENGTQDRKFCTICGSELQNKTYDTFDPKTGIRKVGKTCRKCHPCDHEWLRLPWWHWSDLKCAKCGKKEVGVY